MFSSLVPSLLLSLSLFPVSHAQEAPARVLHLGNSYTFFHDLQLRVADGLRSSVPALSAVEGARLTAGGLRLPDHVQRVEAGDPQWTEALTGPPGQWTWMVLQDQSQIPGFPESEPYWQDSAAAVTVLDGYAVEQEAETVLFMTWGRRDGDSTNPAMFPDFETMNDRLDAGYRAYASRASEPGRTIWVAPVGRAFGAVYTRVAMSGVAPEDPDTDFFRLYDNDGSHPSPLGTALSAAVFVRTFTGWAPRWDTPPPGVDEADLGWLVEAANGAVEPFADLPYPWAWLRADAVPPADVDPTLGWAISGDRLCQTVGVDDAPEAVERITVGALHGDTPGCGRLWMLEGGSLTADRVESESVGEVVVAGGALSVEQLGVSTQVVGGDLTVLGAATAPISVRAGSLSWSEGSTGTRLTLAGGTLRLAAGAGPRFSDAVSLAGTLEVTEPPPEDVALLTAATVVLEDRPVHNLGDGWSLEVRAEDGMETLWAVHEDGGDEGDGTAGESAAGGDDGDATADEPPAEDGLPTDASPTDKSGCSVVPGAMGGLVAVLLGVAGRRRRDG